MSSKGSGFRGVSLHYTVDSRDEVDAVMTQAVQAGASVVQEVAATQWGCCGYFSDPDGYLWKVATGG